MTCFNCNRGITQDEVSVMLFGQPRHYDRCAAHRDNTDAIARILGSDDEQYELFERDGFIWTRNPDGIEAQTPVTVDAGSTANAAVLESWGPEGYKHPFNLRLLPTPAPAR